MEPHGPSEVSSVNSGCGSGGEPVATLEEAVAIDAVEIDIDCLIILFHSSPLS